MPKTAAFPEILRGAVIEHVDAIVESLRATVLWKPATAPGGMARLQCVYPLA